MTLIDRKDLTDGKNNFLKHAVEFTADCPLLEPVKNALANDIPSSEVWNLRTICLK